MRASRPWVVSLLLHGAVVGVATLALDDAPPPVTRELITIDVVEVPAEPLVPVDDPVVMPAEADDDAGEGGTPEAGVAAERTAKRGGPEPGPLEEAAPARGVIASELDGDVPASVTEALGIEIGGEGVGGMSEAGLGSLGATGFGGAGGGDGRGGGGDGRGSAVKRPSKQKSKARPARLIYPKRFRKERDGEVFVVILKVDENGAVDGVKLKQGVNRHQDEKAMNAVWRFRYDPARDDDGRPIASKIEQRFMVDQ